jgi:hypothetical protein
MAKKLTELGSAGALGQVKLGGNIAGMKKSAPPLPAGDPFENVEYTGDPEADTLAELNEYQKACKENIRNYQATIEGVFDSEFWFAVSFRNREAKEAFLKEFGIDRLGDKYIDGGQLAKMLRKLKK